MIRAPGCLLMSRETKIYYEVNCRDCSDLTPSGFSALLKSFASDLVNKDPILLIFVSGKSENRKK